MTDFPITALTSVEIASPDIAKHAEFFEKTWGLAPVAAPGSDRYFAGSGTDPYLLAIKSGSSATLVSVSFRCASDGARTAILARAEAAGCRIEGAVDPGPGGGTAIDFTEPRGMRIRLIHGDQLKPADSEENGRITRLSHVNINTADVDGLADFYRDIMGFQLTDRSRPMAFLRCNSDHHAVVLAQAPVEGLNHIAFLQPGWEGVMLASGRMIDHGYEMGWGVGRHGPGNNVFAYFVDPMGFVVEHTAEIEQVDDSYPVGQPSDWVWPPGRSDRWGIAPPKTEVCKAAQLAIPFEAPSRQHAIQGSDE